MPGSAFLDGDRVTLRTIEEGDLDFLQDLINDPTVRRYLGSRAPFNGEQERDWFENRVSSDENVNLLICVDGERAGSVSLGPADHPDGEAEIGIMLAEEFWGYGYGTEAARLITDYAFDDLRKHRVVARVIDGNEGSARIWEKLGFRREATFEEARFNRGEYVDSHLYAVLEREWRGEE